MRIFQPRLMAFVFIAGLFTVHPTEARQFKNAYISFEIQDNWRCKSEVTEFVCRSEDPQESKEAVIILTAKEKGPTDSFAIYKDHLSKPVPLVLKSGATKNSVLAMPPRDIQVGGQNWVDAMHLGSEVQNYYTRYLATIKDDKIAILTTFSVHQNYYNKHSSHFIKTVQSMKVVATKDLLSRPESGPLRGSNEMLGSSINSAMPADLLAADDGLGEKKQSSSIFDNNMFLGLIVLIIAAIGYVAFKFYKNKR